MEWSKIDLTRFWKNINKNSGIYGDNNQYPTECWNWIGGKESGYGRIYFHHKLFLAHRISWELYYETIPDELFVLHKCDNRACVNPEHLFLGTRGDNNRDRNNKGRSSGGRNGGKTNSAIGENNNNAKLCEQDIFKIRSMIEAGQSGASIARKYNVTRSLIYAIKLKRLWKHIA